MKISNGSLNRLALGTPIRHRDRFTVRVWVVGKLSVLAHSDAAIQTQRMRFQFLIYGGAGFIFFSFFLACSASDESSDGAASAAGAGGATLLGNVDGDGQSSTPGNQALTPTPPAGVCAENPWPKGVSGAKATRAQLKAVDGIYQVTTSTSSRCDSILNGIVQKNNLAEDGVLGVVVVRQQRVV